MILLRLPVLLLAMVLWLGVNSWVKAQSLEEELRQQSAANLAAQARDVGDAARGAVVFFQPYLACSKCHATGDGRPTVLGPDLTTIGKEVRDETLVESVLLPSKVIRQGFQSVTVTMNNGTSRTGVLVERTDQRVTFRDLARGGEEATVPVAEVDEVTMNAQSIMPAGQVNHLASRQQFLDLIRYLIEIRDGGAERAKALQPSPTLVTLTLPEYEQHLDHAGLIKSWNADSLKRGEAIYRRVCANCHGTRDQPGSLPTSLRFAEGPFKNGSDPWRMYQTITRGFGLMAAQTWMVPSQKYDVVHYIRETYLRRHDPSQFVPVTEDYLARLPAGDTRGPEPSKIEPWSAMDYGPTLTHTYEVPGERTNFAYKGIAIRLDAGPGGVSRGQHWTVFDTDTLRFAAAWSATKSGDANSRFIDWRGIQMNGEHQVHPHLVGHVNYANSSGPGWANPQTSQFVDDARVKGRDGRRYGPLPRDWARFRGLYHFQQRAILSYTVGTTEILESPGVVARDAFPNSPIFLRTLNIGPRRHELVLQMAEASVDDAEAIPVTAVPGSPVAFSAKSGTGQVAGGPGKVVFDGKTYVQVADATPFDLTDHDFTLTARLKTKTGGSIFALATPGPKWIPDGQTLFVRNGHLCFDIGWVGVITSKSKVNEAAWHDVAMSWEQSQRRVRLYVDGRLDAEGTLAAKAKLPEALIRIGMTAPDFPQPDSYFRGELDDVRFYQRRLTDELSHPDALPTQDKSLVGHWKLDQIDDRVRNHGGQGHHGRVVHGTEASDTPPASLLFGFEPRNLDAQWKVDHGRLTLRIPAGDQSLKLSVWGMERSPSIDQAGSAAQSPRSEPEIPVVVDDLTALTRGGPARWPQKLETTVATGAEDGSFAVDVMTAPETNPWLAQLRFTGLDFFPDGRIALCTWDGDVWIVQPAPLSTGDATTTGPSNWKQKLVWRRIASGLFQPLGLKIVDGKIHVICRDQLAVLHDLNGDGETDFYECLNNDHQVTEHFHEFAMGLQTDAEGNFYYAKSGRHALEAVVPHHGTLLRISKDGSKTDILATGFRAANGVCLNPDGSFVVTDQEGFWNPKNRINWVTPGPEGRPKFYGNMFGYHDVTDSSDAAMEPPLCWITNAFDRSPAELLWVPANRWGRLGGSLLNLSYGYGKVFVVPHENVNGLVQGGMIELPIPNFPTGVMRGRFHPQDGQLYLCGMFAWAGNATQPGGFYRLRDTGQAMNLPIALKAKKSSLILTFTDPVDDQAIAPDQIQIKTWSLKRTAKYGSDHFDEKPLTVRQVSRSDDGKTVRIEVADLQPTWCMEIKYRLRIGGKAVTGTIHNTIHNLGEE